MAKLHMFLNHDDVLNAVHQYLTSRNVEVSTDDLYFFDTSTREQVFSLEVEAMNVTLTDLYTGI